MKKDLTELVFILDRSGSMSGLESDTIGGYNSMMAKQKKEPGDAFVTTVLFDDGYELLHDRINLRGVEPITSKEYFVRGSTALLDAIGKTINKIGNAQKQTSEDERAEKVIFVITTDGMENSSREFTYEIIKKMVDNQKMKYGWEFIFLGANIDAVAEARRFGITEDRAARFNSDSIGTSLNYDVVGEAVKNLRSNRTVAREWKKRIDDDYNERGEK
ncbi:MAG: VWA domain-containing protein [Peptostreptococcaceae bacterium]|nr:VWA domain-containing protein [Peptostreptococcaceae bacterium]